MTLLAIVKPLINPALASRYHQIAPMATVALCPHQMVGLMVKCAMQLVAVYLFIAMPAATVNQRADVAPQIVVWCSL
ncbi:MAG: hypothetical protein D6706_09345 [Chloroflexi bacterium]|nr:MAG: hypothetical protein D6706_09345 [Chloroflexota bacterium]